MDRGLTLPENTQCDPADLSADEKLKRRITKIPNTFTKSLETFAANPLWKSIMGEEMYKIFLLSRQNECNFFQEKSDAEIRKWHLKRY